MKTLRCQLTLAACLLGTAVAQFALPPHVLFFERVSGDSQNVVLDVVLLNRTNRVLNASFGDCPIAFRVTRGNTVIYTYSRPSPCTTALRRVTVPPRNTAVVTNIQIPRRVLAGPTPFNLRGDLEIEIPETGTKFVAFVGRPD